MAEENKETTQEQKAATVADELVAKFGDRVKAEFNLRNEPTVSVAVADVIPVLTWLLKERKPAFNMLMDVCGADYLEREKRFDVVYHLLSMARTERLRIKVQVADGEEVPSAIDLYRSADWPEREVYDMFGVKFSGHPNMKRILMWEGYDGFPLRKDFPLKGNRTMKERYAAKDKRRSKDMKQYCWEGYCTDL